MTEYSPQVATATQLEAYSIIDQICAGYPAALNWFIQFTEVAKLWDHMHDKDPLGMDPEKAFEWMMLEWPRNQFFVSNSGALVPVMVNALSAWRSSDKDEALRVKAYDVYVEVATTVAYLLGGLALVSKHIPRLRAIIPELMAENDTRASQDSPERMFCECKGGS